MKITEHEMRGLIQGKCLPADIMVGEYLPAYLVRKFSELQQKLDAVVAENAALRKFIIESCYTYDGDGSDICDSYVSAEESPLFPSSTDTAAIMNSLRAEGVEMVADAIGQKCSELKVGSKEWKSLKSIVFTLISFSSQLRAGDADRAELNE